MMIPTMQGNPYKGGEEEVVYEEEQPKKGFNPLFLAAALVVVTILVAAGLSFWATNISERRSEVLTGKCSGYILLYTGSFDPDQNKLNIIIDNRGSMMSELKLFLDYSENDVREYDLDQVLPANSLETITVSNVQEGFEKGTLKTECSTIQLDFVEESGNLRQI
jgi:hypothetical protein